MPGLEDYTPRMWFLSVVGWAITILTIRSFVCFWKHDDHLGVVWLVSGFGLTLIFFRNRKILLTVLGLTFIGVNAGLDALFHPSATSISLTIGSALGMYVLTRWSSRKFPNLISSDWKTLFDADPKP
jgi:hypothetical protein